MNFIPGLGQQLPFLKVPKPGGGILKEVQQLAYCQSPEDRTLDQYGYFAFH
jgi:hypothetical protein